MSQFNIIGPTKLAGEFDVLGSKNAVLPIMAASLLIEGQVEISNVPNITDVSIMCDILTHLGAKISRDDRNMTIDASNAVAKPIPTHLSAKMRASILFLCPMLARFGEVELPLPGGDIIGSRPLDVHLTVIQGLGAAISMQNSTIKADGKLHNADIIIEALSVTGTENAIMAAVLTSGTTILRMCATEPHVTALAKFLISAGAKISGIGSHTLVIEGVERLNPTQVKIIPDYLEAGTIAIAAATTNSRLVVNNFIKSHNEALLLLFSKIGVNYRFIGDNKLEIIPSSQLKPITARTDIFPGFPSDLQAPLAVLLTQTQGTSEIFETVFEGRLNYLRELERMGANVFAKDAHTGIIIGPTPLHGKETVSIDIRAGATLVIAALLAEGETIVDHIEHIDRGYESFDTRLNAIGAHIKRL